MAADKDIGSSPNPCLVSFSSDLRFIPRYIAQPPRLYRHIHAYGSAQNWQSPKLIRAASSPRHALRKPFPHEYTSAGMKALHCSASHGEGHASPVRPLCLKDAHGVLRDVLHAVHRDGDPSACRTAHAGGGPMRGPICAHERSEAPPRQILVGHRRSNTYKRRSFDTALDEFQIKKSRKSSLPSVPSVGHLIKRSSLNMLNRGPNGLAYRFLHPLLFSLPLSSPHD